MKEWLKSQLHTPWLWYCGVYSQNSEIYINILKLCETNITCNVTCFPRTWLIRHLILLNFFKLQRLKCNVTCFRVRDVIFRVSCSHTFTKKIIFVTESIFYKFYYFPQFSFSDHNLFLLSILQHVIASKCNYINTMLPNEMVLALLQKLKIKYELSYQSTTRLKYIDKFDQLLIIHQWSSSVDNTVRSLTHFTIFIWYYVVKHFQFFMKNIIIK
jgi:hypothetical protein